MSALFRSQLHASLPIWIFATSVLLVAGCSSDDEKLPPVYPVFGTVTYGGQPLAGATVVFRSTADSSAKPAIGLSDAQGRFQLSTFGENDGVIAGQHSVSVSKMTSVEGGEKESMEAAAAAAARNEPEAKSEIPEKYSDPQTSGLQETVKEDGGNEFKFELVD